MKHTPIYSQRCIHIMNGKPALFWKTHKSCAQIKHVNNVAPYKSDPGAPLWTKSGTGNQYRSL